MFIINPVLCKYNRILVSGASENHGNLLILMIYRIIKVEENICFIVWNLGLNNNQNLKIKKLINYIKKSKNSHITVIYYTFNFKDYPSYFNITIDAGNYAWKPVIIYNTYKMFKRTLFWLDAGCYVNGSLLAIYNIISKNEIWSISAGHSIKRYTYISTILYYNVSEYILNKIMCAAGVVGFVYPSKFCMLVLQKWNECALKINCIAPIGSSRKNHRQDQSALSIILYQSGYKFNCLQYKNLNFSLQFDAKIHKYNYFDS